MYNEKILNQLDNLKYLGALKGSNVAIVSKPNEFGDAVKFYAQINKDDIIQKISYRASGCTHFLVFCNYFCSLVDGKSIKSALNVKAEKLENFVELDESKSHIVSIILDAFDLLIKRYRKGVEKGKIEPCEVATKAEDTPKTRPMTSKAFTKVVGEIMKNIELSHKNDNQIAVSKNSDTLSKLVEAKNRNHATTEQKTEDIKVNKNKTTNDNKIEEKVVENTPSKNEDNKPKNATKRTKKATNEEKVESSKNIDKDELLENLVDEGIFLYDYTVDNKQDTSSTKENSAVKEELIQDNKPVKEKKTTRKSTKKQVDAPVVEEEKTIEELNKEITGLIDIFEDDIVTPANVENEPNKLDVVDTNNTVVESKDNDLDIPNEKKTTKTTKKVEKQPKKDNLPKEDKKSTSKIEKTLKKIEDKNIVDIEKPEQVKEVEVKEELVKEDKTTKQNNNLLALKSMLNNRNNATTNSTKHTSEEKVVEEKKPENKMNNLSAMISKMHSNDSNNTTKKAVEKKTTSDKSKTKKVETKKDANKNKAQAEKVKEDKLSSLKLSLANIRTNNDTATSNSDTLTKLQSARNDKAVDTTKASSKADKKANKKEKVERVKVEKQKKEKVDKKAEKTSKKVEKKVEKQPKDTTPKKSKKKDYDMEYEPIDDGSKKGFFSWLKRK